MKVEVIPPEPTPPTVQITLLPEEAKILRDALYQMRIERPCFSGTQMQLAERLHSHIVDIGRML